MYAYMGTLELSIYLSNEKKKTFQDRLGRMDVGRSFAIYGCLYMKCFPNEGAMDDIRLRWVGLSWAGFFDILGMDWDGM